MGKWSRFHYGYVIQTIGFFIVMCVMGFGRHSYTVILPMMKSSLHLNYTQIGLMSSGYFLGYLFFSLAGGFLATKYGPRFVISLGTTLAGVAMFFTGNASSFYFAILMRSLTGTGSGISFVPTMGLASAWFISKRRGTATGLLMSGSGLGMVITGKAVPRALAQYGMECWHYCWYLMGTVTILLGIISFFFLRNSPDEKGLVPIGKESVITRQASKTTYPILKQKAIFKYHTLWYLGLIYFTFGFSYAIYITFFSVYLGGEKGMPPQFIGNLWSILGLISILGAAVWGLLSDYLSRKFSLATIFLFVACSLIVLAFSNSTIGYYLSAILLGCTALSTVGIMAAICGDYLGPRYAPAALGMITFLMSIGQVLGPSIAGYLTDILNSSSQAFLLAALLALCGSLGSCFLKYSPPDTFSLPANM